MSGKLPLIGTDKIDGNYANDKSQNIKIDEYSKYIILRDKAS